MTGAESKRDGVYSTMCAAHCGGNCILKVHVRDGVIVRTETDDGAEPQLRACMRGRALRQRIYSEDRILYPMRRSGKRGEGKFERISWDEALDAVASEIRRVREIYGPLSLMYLSLGGDLSLLHTAMTMGKLLAMSGGYTGWWGATSYHGGMWASAFSYGTIFCSNTRDDLLNSRLIIMWGWDPAGTSTGTNTPWYLAQAKENGTRIVAVDPFYTDSAATFAHQWIPIRPGSDAAALIAMAHVMIRENLQDQPFLDRYTVGFDRFREYVMGQEDGVAKTPAWAETITGVPASVIEAMAREYATTRPAALMAGIAPGRTAYGEQYHRAAITLAAMTGNVGVHGGDAAARAWEAIIGGYPFPLKFAGEAFPLVPNPMEDPTRTDGVPIFGYTHPKIHYAKVSDAILRGKAGGYPADYKMAIMVNNNYLNSYPDINKAVKALMALEFIVIEEQFMTATARYADILLPTSSFVEREDIALGAAMPYYGFQKKIIDRMGDTMPHNDIAKALAAKMGIPDYDLETAEDRLKRVAKKGEIPDYELFREKAVHWIDRSEPYVAFEQQILDPERNPFPTPSGKIEIYSRRIGELNNPKLPPIPKYIEIWESPNDPLARRYPIQLITKHSKRRANAQFDTLPWLKELIPQAVSISDRDADARGIKEGDLVRVFNDRGETRIPAKVTRRIAPGVASLPAGAWYDPDENGIDRGGSANVLTSSEISPVGSYAFNALLVQIEKV